MTFIAATRICPLKGATRLSLPAGRGVASASDNRAEAAAVKPSPAVWTGPEQTRVVVKSAWGEG